MDLSTPVPAWYAAKRAGVSRQLFNYWRRTGKIAQAVDEATGGPLNDDGGNPLYRLRDALTVERDTRKSTQSSRNPTRGHVTASDWAELDRKAPSYVPA